jgi:hypothetical protein
MKKFRLVAAAAMVACALLLAGDTGTAAAQNATTRFAQIVPVTGEGKNGRPFTGTYAIKRFVKRDGGAWAVGTLKNRKVTLSQLVQVLNALLALSPRTAGTR